MEGITYIYNVNGKRVGMYTNGQCLPVEDESKSPADNQVVLAANSKPEPKQEISFWQRALDIVSVGGLTGGVVAGCTSTPNGSDNISQACKDSVEPNFKPYKDMDPISTLPSPFYKNDYTSESGVTVTWEPESAVPNCDGKFDHQRIVVHFRDGDQTFYPVNGKIKIEKNFKYEPATSMVGDFIFYNPNTDAEFTKSGVVTLYPPTPAQETNQCYAPRIDGDIQTDPTTVYVGQLVKIFKSQDTIIPQCSEGNLKVSFVVENQTRGAEMDEQNNYYVLYTFQQHGWATVTLKATQGDLVSRKDIGFNVEESVTTPPASILAPSAAKSGEEITLIALGANEALFDYTWDFGDGTPEAQGATVTKTYTLPSGKMATITVKLTVSDKGNPTAQDVTTQKITIVPPSVSIPSFALNIPQVAEEGHEVTMSVDNLIDPNWEISWNFGDGSPVETGQTVDHTYANPIKYNIVCKLTNKDDLNYIIESPFTITIIPHGNPVPNLEITPGMGSAPLSVTADASKSYATDASASIINYTFNWGDGSTEEKGPEAKRQHTFTCSNASCAYTVRVTVTDSNGSFTTISAAVATWQ